MNFTEFIRQNHPDTDSLLNPKFDQLCKLAEDYAEYKQLLQLCVSNSFYCQDEHYDKKEQCAKQCITCFSKE